MENNRGSNQLFKGAIGGFIFGIIIAALVYFMFIQDTSKIDPEDCPTCPTCPACPAPTVCPKYETADCPVCPAVADCPASSACPACPACSPPASTPPASPTNTATSQARDAFSGINNDALRLGL